ncbi:MBL fold metallo-hydrolase [Adhaeribacter radiodurans]|uniref:MBL fold metallo-hydrolase n=1 Tax=Adhaeribacter radiodurans TaxID=2745197 RepID=UPI001FE9CED3|nr:MBL fold metallo-hydrolase [Adhaeribacter radiodurans]
MLFLQHPKFGKHASGARLEGIKQSPHFKEGKFQNLSYTPDLAEGASYYRVMKEFFFNKSSRNVPATVLPSQKTDLLNLPQDQDVLVWFGHSSYFIQLDGKRILVDPIFSGSASPVKFTTPSFKGSDVYTVDDIPDIDYLLISHDHWDHLDYETVLKLKPKVIKVITGLGTGAHLEYWGYAPDRIIEKDWNEEVPLEDGFMVYTTPGRHFSGRGLKRNQSLWTSFVLKTPSMKIFIGGDSGYDTHFKTIGDTYGPFDLAILECGQYNAYWKYIHMMPEEVVQAAQDLGSTKLFPVHWAKFSLALHAWDEPIIRVTAEAQRRQMPLLHPMIGEAVPLKETKSFTRWWEKVASMPSKLVTEPGPLTMAD